MPAHALAVQSAPRSIAAQFRKMLYATDFSPASLQALHYVSFLARQYGSTLFLAHVISPGARSPVPAEMLETPVKELSEEAGRLMKELENSTELRGVSHKRLMGTGDISEWLLQAVQKHNIGLIVMGTHGRTGMRRLMLGSVAEEVFRTAPCPVLTVSSKVHPPEKIRRILFASDFSEASQCGVPFAASLASDAKAELVALHVLPSTTAANPEVNQLVDPLREELRKMFAGYLPKGMEPEAMISFGDAAEVIVREAELLAADLIVLGVRHGFSSHGFTNIAYRVAISSPCPVLSVRETIAARH